MSDQLALGLSVPDSYADTLARVDYEANGNRNVNGGYVATYDELHWSIKDRLRNQSRAVAAQVLRDVRAALTEREYSAVIDGRYLEYADDVIDRFAGERGIDLEDLS